MNRGTHFELEPLRRVAAFRDMPDTVLAALARDSLAVAFEAGERLLTQAETADFALVVLSGQVSVVNETTHGHLALAQLSAPTLIGEVATLGRLARIASVVALTPVQALQVHREVLLEACRHRPEILQSVIAQLGHHIQHVNQALSLFSDGFEALEREDFDPAILEDLNHPVEEVRDFAIAFERLAHRISSERRNRDEMASAALIQRAMLPEPLAVAPLGGRAAVFGDMKPAREVGGDFYDIFMLDADHLAIAIGDVCGKGVPASLFMSVTVTTLRLAARDWKSLSGLLQTANDLLCARNPTLMFATAFFGVLDLNDGRFEYASCGHNPPLVFRRDGDLAPLPSGGSPLGIAPGKAIRTAGLSLGPGDGLFLFTDGVTESVDPAGALYGDERLRATLERCAGFGAEPLVAAVMADVDRFTDGAEPFDDITCLAVVRC